MAKNTTRRVTPGVTKVKPRATPKSAARPVSEDSRASLEGRQAPDFELPDQSGKPIALGDLTARGQVVLYFYPKDMTPGCTAEACSFRDNLEELRAAGAQLVGISADSPASHQKFIEKHQLNFPLLSDSGHEVSRAYGVYKKKSLYGREFMGIERSTFIIAKDGIVRKVFPKVKVNGHSAEVLTALKQSD